MLPVGAPRRAAAFQSISPSELLEQCHNASNGIMWLDSTVRFRRRTRQNPASFFDFIQALRDVNNNITSVHCYPFFVLGIREDEWLELLRTFGQMETLQNLLFLPSYEGFKEITADALAETIERSSSIKTLELSMEFVMNGMSADYYRFARAVAASKLTHFVCDCLFRYSDEIIPLKIIVNHGMSRCSTLEVLSFRDYRNVLSEEDVSGLILCLAGLKHLRLYTHHWRGLGKGMAQNNTIQVLEVTDPDANPAAFCECMENMERNRTIRSLTLKLRFKTNRMKESLASFLENNESLENMVLSNIVDGIAGESKFAFSSDDLAFLVGSIKKNGLVQVNVDDTLGFVNIGGRYDRQGLFRYRQQLDVENKLNEVGRRDLRRTTGDRTKWLKAMLLLVDGNVPDSEYYEVNEDLFRTQCLFGLFLMNPSIFEKH